MDLRVEEIQNLGFTIVEDVLDAGDLVRCREKIDTVYAMQEEEMGVAYLETIKEKDMCRLPLKYDEFFIDMAIREPVLELVKVFLGEYFILNLQNAIINTSSEVHHQSSWHRDLPYQNYTISRPLAINALFCIDDFSYESGGTVVVPYTHKMEVLPSDRYIEKHQVTAEAKAGSVIVFDSMLFHKAGFNHSNNTRRALNHIYTTPIMKQFYDIPKALGGKYGEDPFLSQLLGYTSATPMDDVAWRHQRYKRFSDR